MSGVTITPEPIFFLVVKDEHDNDVRVPVGGHQMSYRVDSHEGRSVDDIELDVARFEVQQPDRTVEFLLTGKRRAELAIQ